MAKDKKKSNTEKKSSSSTNDDNSTSTNNTQKRKAQEVTDGLAEIDSLFSTKKDTEKQIKKQRREDEKQAEEERRRRKAMRKNMEEDGPMSVAALKGKKCKTISLDHDRSDTDKIQNGEWANDGLGGIFDREGYTGRVSGGVKVFKAHLFNKKGFGTTKDCPFDCSCCYI